MFYMLRLYCLSQFNNSPMNSLEMLIKYSDSQSSTNSMFTIYLASRWKPQEHTSAFPATNISYKSKVHECLYVASYIGSFDWDRQYRPSECVDSYSFWALKVFSLQGALTCATVFIDNTTWMVNTMILIYFWVRRQFPCRESNTSFLWKLFVTLPVLLMLFAERWAHLAFVS